jgi:hypothetical protein
MSSHFAVESSSNEETSHPGKKTPSEKRALPVEDATTSSDELQQKQRFPQDYFPVLFSDGALSTSHTDHIVKFYLARIDPNVWGEGGSKPTPVMQIVMPSKGFLLTTAFFIKTIETMISDGTISQDLWDEIKNSSARQSRPEAAARDDI